RHGEERHAVGVARRDHGNDVRVLQLRDELDLAVETIEADAPGEVRRQQLDHDLTIESSLGGEKDVAHATATELALDGVVVAECGLEAVAKIVRHEVERYRSGFGWASEAPGSREPIRVPGSRRSR